MNELEQVVNMSCLGVRVSDLVTIFSFTSDDISKLSETSMSITDEDVDVLM